MIADLTDPATTVAVVGATDEPGKYGGRVLAAAPGARLTGDARATFSHLSTSAEADE